MRPRKPSRDGNSPKMVVPAVSRRLLNLVWETGRRHGRNRAWGERHEGGREETGTLEKRERLACGKGENKQIRPPGEARSGQRNNWGGRGQAQPQAGPWSVPQVMESSCQATQTRPPAGRRPQLWTQTRERLEAGGGEGRVWGWETGTPASFLLFCRVTPGSHWPSLGLSCSCLV